MKKSVQAPELFPKEAGFLVYPQGAKGDALFLPTEGRSGSSCSIPGACDAFGLASSPCFLHASPCDHEAEWHQCTGTPTRTL